jgi:hypothetical protein
MEFKSKVSSKVYSLEALKLASYILENWNYSLKEKGPIVEISVKGNNPDIGYKELLNEALNQQCRIDLFKTNSKIANLITTKALLSALGEES